MQTGVDPPPTFRWCAGPAGLLYEQSLIAMQQLLARGGETHWWGWITTDLALWREQGSTSRHLSAYGGMGSFNDLVLNVIDDAACVWLDDAIRVCQHIACQSARAAEQSAETFCQVSPSSMGKLTLYSTQCQNCRAEVVTSTQRDGGAATAWASHVVPERIQAGRGSTVAPAAAGDEAPDTRQEYIAFVDRAISAAKLCVVVDRHERPWRCPDCGHDRCRLGLVSLF